MLPPELAKATPMLRIRATCTTLARASSWSTMSAAWVMTFSSSEPIAVASPVSISAGSWEPPWLGWLSTIVLPPVLPPATTVAAITTVWSWLTWLGFDVDVRSGWSSVVTVGAFSDEKLASDVVVNSEVCASVVVDSCVSGAGSVVTTTVVSVVGASVGGASVPTGGSVLASAAVTLSVASIVVITTAATVLNRRTTRSLSVREWDEWPSR